MRPGQHHPLESDSVAGVHCAAALYLISEPATVVAEIARVLRPGARLVGMTLVAPAGPIGPLGHRRQAIFYALSGLRYVTAHELAAMCSSAGMVDFHYERRGAALMFHADLPD